MAKKKTVFYGFLTRNQVEATHCATSVETLNAIFEGLTPKPFKAGVKTVRRHQISSEVRGNTASPNWLNANYAARQFEEKSDNQTLSFFTPEKNACGSKGERTPGGAPSRYDFT